MANAAGSNGRSVTLAIENDVAIVSINRPPLNLLSRSTKAALLDVFLSLEARSDVRAVLLRGAGSNAFSAGADITEFPQRIRDGDAGTVSREGHDLIQAVRHCGKPTIAAVDGVAFGAGLELILAVDLRIASDNASFALPESTRGVFPGNGGTQLLPRIVGPANALDLMLTADPIDSIEAYRIGLVQRLTKGDNLMHQALRWAENMASRPEAATSSIRRLVAASSDIPLEKGFELEADLFAEVFRTEAVYEGVTAFQEKRPADFRFADRHHRERKSSRFEMQQEEV
ncbi:enoyl-CoA hydratase/isomerase family protein [Arthrobacter pigmenti]